MKHALLLLVLAIFTSSAAAQPEKAEVLKFSETVIATLKAKDMTRLANIVHPVKGVRIAPYAYVSSKDRLFKASQIRGLLKDKKRYLWGEYDESGKPIRATFAKYYGEFVYDYDFAKADKINYNLKRNNGIMVTNVASFFPKGIEIEYFFNGTEERMYASLRLIYEHYRGKWYLVGIVRDTPGI
jgi:hypothetical protein